MRMRTEEILRKENFMNLKRETYDLACSYIFYYIMHGVSGSGG